MARGDGINRTSARNMRLTTPKLSNTQQHNEREKDSYVNQDIVPERSHLNVHFKAPTDDYLKMFQQMEANGVISTRGIKEDAYRYGELIFDVNSAYFFNHGGYDFAKQFYADAYKAAIKIVGGEQYILSAVMHADERNRAMSEALGQDVYHYHLHVVYVPVVEKQILWSKRCKDKSLVGKVKETVMQVSMSKKWISKPAINAETGEPLLTSKGKPVLKKSYSVLQDDFFQHMRDAGYTDVERGERGSSEEHLTVTQFKLEQEAARLEALETKVEKKEQTLKKIEQKTNIRKMVSQSHAEIDGMGRKTLMGKIEFTQQEAVQLKQMAKNSISAEAEIGDLKQKLTSAKKDAQIWKQRYEKLLEQTKDFLAALKQAPERVKDFIDRVLHAKRPMPQRQSKGHDKGLAR